MSSPKSLIQFSIMASVLLLPIAHLKIAIFGIPIYSVEAPIIIALCFYIYGLQQGSFSLRDRINFHNPFFIGILLFFLGALFSFLANPFSLTSLGMIKTWFVFPIIMFWLWLETEPDNKDLKRLLFIWLASSILVAIASLIFFFQGVLTYDGRLSAWYASPNYLAFFLAYGVLLASYSISNLSFLYKKFFYPLLFLLVLLIVVIFLTGSYTTWISVFAALALYFYLIKLKLASRRQKISSLLLFIGIFITFIFLESDSEKWQSIATLSERSSLASRVMIWRSAVSIISDYPFLGIGIGRFQEMYLAYQKYFPLYLEWAVPQPHNLYLAIWLQTGIVGLAGFGFLISVWLKKMFILWHSSAQDENKKWSALLIALMVLFLLLGIADTPFFKTDLVFIFWLILALGISLWNQRSIR